MSSMDSAYRYKGPPNSPHHVINVPQKILGLLLVFQDPKLKRYHLQYGKTAPFEFTNAFLYKGRMTMLDRRVSKDFSGSRSSTTPELYKYTYLEVYIYMYIYLAYSHGRSCPYAD